MALPWDDATTGQGGNGGIKKVNQTAAAIRNIDGPGLVLLIPGRLRVRKHCDTRQTNQSIHDDTHGEINECEDALSEYVHTYSECYSIIAQSLHKWHIRETLFQVIKVIHRIQPPDMTESLLA